MSVRRHKWKKIPREQPISKSFKFPSSKEFPEGLQINLGMIFILDPKTIKSLKRCENCNQESINGKKPKHDCDEFITQQVIDS